MKLFTVLLIVIPTLSFSQNGLTYSEIIKQDSVSKEELYDRAALWFSVTFNSSSDVIKLQGKEQGQIIGKAIIPYNPTVFICSDLTRGYIRYTIKIFVKEERYKYEIADFIHHPNSNRGYGMNLITTEDECPYKHKNTSKKWNDKVWNDIKNQINNSISPLVESLKTDMSTVTETQNNDW